MPAKEAALACPSVRAQAGPGTLAPLDWAVVVTVSLANLVPVWAFRYFPGQDTPNHLYGAEVLRVLLDGTAPPSLRDAFTPALGLKSNVGFHAVLLALSHLGVPLMVGHKLFLSFLALALPLGVLRLTTVAAPGNRPLALLFLPLAWSWFIVQGLYNYVLSLLPALVWLGAVASNDSRPRLRGLVTVALCAAAVYLCHVGTLVALLVVTGIRILLPGDGRAATSRARAVWCGQYLVALSPTLLVAARSALAALPAASAREPEVTLAGWEAYDLPGATLDFVVEFAMRYHAWELLILGPPLIALVWLPLRAWSRLRATPARANPPVAAPAVPLATPESAAPASPPGWPLRAALALGVLYLALPHIVSGSDVAPRLRPIIVFCLLCLRGAALTRRARRWLAIAALGSGLAGVAALCGSFRGLNRDLDDFTAGIPHVRDGARLYPMIFDPRSPSRLVKPFLHAWGYYGIERHVVTPFGFAWHDSRFPYRYRRLPLHTATSSFPSDSEDEPYALLQGRLCASERRLASSLACDDVRGRAERRLTDLGKLYDYVLTWAAPKDFTTLLAAEGYRPVYNQGRMDLFASPIARAEGARAR